MQTASNPAAEVSFSTAPLLTEDITINNTEQYSPTNKNNNLDITTNNMQVLGQTNNTTLATITTLEEVTKSNKQRVNRPRQTKTKFTPYNITIPEYMHNSGNNIFQFRKSAKDWSWAKLNKNC